MAPNSPVQDRALEYLDMFDEVAKERSRLDFVKGLVVAPDADLDRVKEQFPEYFSDDPFEEIRTETGEYDINRLDDSKVEWSVATPEQDEEIERWLAEREQDSFTGADVNHEWT